MYKTDIKHKEFNPKVFTSAGIGKGYLERSDSNNNKYKKEKTQETYKARNGAITALPKYYRNKMYSDEEREALWMQLLDKEKRYVNGIEIDVSDGYEEYFQVLEQERAKNKRLGYGNDEKNWEQIEYENSIRRNGKKN